MPAAQDTTCESSVAFNLRQLLELEHERIAREEFAVRAAREARERARAEREAAEREAAEQRARAAAEAARRAADEREAVLLRVRLEVAARERASDQRQAEAHAKQLAQLESARRRGRARAAWLSAGGLLVVGALAAAGFSTAASRIQAAQAAAAEAARTAAERTREIARLRVQLEQKPLPPPAAMQPTLPLPAARARPVLAKRAPKPKPARPTADLELEDGSDPIGGL